MSDQGFSRNLQSVFGPQYGSALGVLAEKRLARVLVSADGDTFALVADDGTFAKFTVEGDCCSRSWVEAITVPSSAIGQPIQTVADYRMSREDDHPEHECLQVYQFEVGTPGGAVVVEFRNSSNGYYGGTVVVADGGLGGMNEVTPGAKE